ncbi:MAG TPA: SRPBCC domain-containing protein [Granulicella sp.]|jgi:uncharacterized protein YndB with AHSA1/START domain|nr:SRPBCC domain-containing protein [Granulicella sp.]
MATPTVEMQGRSEQAEEIKLELKRVIRASRQRVFDAWTRPEFIRQWFAPGTMSMANAEIDLGVGGGYHFQMNPPTGGGEEVGHASRGSRASGTYTRVEPYDVLAFTWCGDWDPGEETQVTITFKDVEGGTELTLLHQRFQSEVSCGKHTQGWTSTLEKLQRFAEA